MSWRALLILVIAVGVALTPVYWASATIYRKSKIIPTDVVIDAFIPDYKMSIMREAHSVTADFTERHGRDGRRSCMTWYASRPIEVYYRIDRERGSPWRASSGKADTYYVGQARYEYRFVRLTDDPVMIVYRIQNRSGRCGYRGSTDQLPQPPTPMDVFTDFVGIARKPYRADLTDVRPLGAVARPGTIVGRQSATIEPARSTPTPQSRFQPRAIEPPPRVQMETEAYWRRVVRAQNSPGMVSLNNRQWSMVNWRLHQLGHWAGSRTTAIKSFQRSIGDNSSGVLNVRQLQRLMLKGSGASNPASKTARRAPQLPRQTLRLTKAQWRQVQIQLNRRGYQAGSEDGVVGAKTVAAIRRFERRFKLPEDGVLSQIEYRELMP